MRDTPQFNSDLAQYDEELFYRLQPGNHRFNNFEFGTDFNVNSLGIRDDETSLNHPKIVAIGDSFTMGWGVNQEESFVALLQKVTSQKSLNAGISSYGTAREYLLLDKIELDSCKVLLLQFCSNDFAENASFVDNNFSLKISPIENYRMAQRTNFLKKTYFPMKFTFSFFAKVVRSSVTFFSKEKTTSISNKSLRMNNFFTIVDLIQKKFKGKIIIFNLESYFTTDEYFKDFKTHLEQYPNNDIFLFDVSKKLKKDDYFYLDDHINSRGHQKVADGIFEMIQENQLLDMPNKTSPN